LQREDNIVCCDWASVTKFCISQLEGILQFIIGDVPALRQSWHQAAADSIRFYQGFENIFLDVDGTVIANANRIHAERFFQAG
jgi:hypothetical protein